MTKQTIINRLMLFGCCSVLTGWLRQLDCRGSAFGFEGLQSTQARCASTHAKRGASARSRP